MTTGKLDLTWHHAAISCRDIDRMLKFYTEVMGFEVEWDHAHRTGEGMSKVVGLPDVDTRMAMLKGYGTHIELFKYYHPAGEERGPKRQCDFGLTHFTFQVKNIHKLYDYLLKHDVAFNCPPENLRPGVWATYMKDIEGNTIELIQYGEA